MRFLLLATTVTAFLIAGVISQPAANAEQVTAKVVTVDVQAKKCGFDSDCSHGKCKGGQCGACGFDSDCKGWGKCSKGQCGACSFSSECKGFGSCSGGRCTKSPY